MQKACSVNSYQLSVNTVLHANLDVGFFELST